MNFSDYLYVPKIRSRGAELAGVKELTAHAKDKILPLIDLCKSNKITEAKPAFDKWLESFDGPAIISTVQDPRVRVNDYNEIFPSADSYINWLKFVEDAKKSNNKIIPNLHLNIEMSKRAFVQQVRDFENAFGKIVFKINPLKKRDFQAASVAASVIQDVSNIMIILDCGQISREHQKPALDATIHALNEIRRIDTAIEIVSMSGSFPRSFAPYCINERETKGLIPMLEWQNYHAMGGQEVAIYGDYASIHGEFYEGAFARFVARIDYPTPSSWIFERRSSNGNDDTRVQLYADAAKVLMGDENWDDSLNCWGANIIREAASGTLEKFGTPGKWISVRLNLHIESIVRYLENGVNDASQVNDSDWIDEEDLDW